jgi:hypothetical protein
MGKLISGVTDAIGLTDHKGQRRAQKNSEASSASATEQARQNLDFQKERYTEWEDIYGDLQSNISKYYKNLGPERVMSLGLQQQQIAHQDTQEKIRRSLTQRGLGGSKFEAYTQTMADMDNSNRRATIRSKAEEQTVNQQMNFLNIGLNQKNQILNRINSASGAGVNASTNQANMYNQQFQTLAQNNSSMTRNLTDQALEMAGVRAGKK